MAIEQIYTVQEVADILKVSKATISRYIKNQQIDAVVLGGGRGRRVTETQIKEFLRRRTPVVKRPRYD